MEPLKPLKPIWETKSRGWHWTSTDGWEIIRGIDPHTDRTRFAIWHGHEIIDFRSSLVTAKRSAESEMKERA